MRDFDPTNFSIGVSPHSDPTDQTQAARSEDASSPKDKHVSQKTQTVAVVGLGSIGAVVAGYLQRAGRHRVIACVKKPTDHVTLVRAGSAETIHLRALTDPQDAEPVDWVILATKAHQTPTAAPWLERLCNSSTRVAVLQNGIDLVSRVAPFVGDATIVPSIVFLISERLTGNSVRFRQVTDYDFIVPDDPNGRAFVELLEGTLLRALAAPDFTTLTWEKLTYNAVTNPITALTLQRFSVFQRSDVLNLAKAMLEETIAVARANGACLNFEKLSKKLFNVLSTHDELGTSMYADRLAGRSLEAEAINGAVVRAGNRVGLPTPLNQVMLTLLSASNNADDHV